MHSLPNSYITVTRRDKPKMSFSITVMPASNIFAFLSLMSQALLTHLEYISKSPSSTVYVAHTRSEVKGILNVVTYFDEEAPILNIHYMKTLTTDNGLLDPECALPMLAECENKAGKAACIYQTYSEKHVLIILRKAGYTEKGWKALQPGYTPSKQIQVFWDKYVVPPTAPLSTYQPIIPTPALFGKAINGAIVMRIKRFNRYETSIDFNMGEFAITLQFVIHKVSFTRPLEFIIDVKSITDCVFLRIANKKDGMFRVEGYTFELSVQTKQSLREKVEKAATFLAFCLSSLPNKEVLNALEKTHAFNSKAVDFNELFLGMSTVGFDKSMTLPLDTIWTQAYTQAFKDATWERPVQCMTAENITPETYPSDAVLPEISLICNRTCPDESISHRRRDVWVDTECSMCDGIFSAINPQDNTIIGRLAFKEAAHITILCLWTLKGSSVDNKKIIHYLIITLENYAHESRATYITMLPHIQKRNILERSYLYEVTDDGMYKAITQGPSPNALSMKYSPTSKLALSSIRIWTTEAYFLFNRALRQGTLTPGHLDIYKGMLAYFNKYALETPLDLKDLKLSRGVVYRGLHPLDRSMKNANVMDELFPNKSFTLEDKGFIAFSKLESVSIDFASKALGKGLLLVFNANDFPDKCLVDIEPVSTWSRERELLALPGHIELVRQLNSGSMRYAKWKAKYTPLPAMTEDDAISGGSAESYIARLFAAKLLKTEKLDIIGKLAVFYNYNPANRKFQILRVRHIKPAIFLPDEIAELDAQQANLPEIKEVWRLLENTRHTGNKKLIGRLMAQAMLTNVSIAIFDGPTIVDWRYGDVYEFPTRYRRALFEAMNEAAAIKLAAAAASTPIPIPIPSS